MFSKNLFESTRLSAERLAEQLNSKQKRIVFAESCTAGLASAMLGQIPGISAWLCGSAVTYRAPVKEAWLQIDHGLIENHSAVSPEVTGSMARAVLAKTEDANVAVAITGHLEPQEADGGLLVYVAYAYRRDANLLCREPMRLRLTAKNRCDRQLEAAQFALEVANRSIQSDVLPTATEISATGSEISLDPTNSVQRVKGD